jgi:hypothetical protein
MVGKQVDWMIHELTGGVPTHYLIPKLEKTTWFHHKQEKLIPCGRHIVGCQDDPL